MELQQNGGTVAQATRARSSRHDVPTSEDWLAGTQLSSSIYGTVMLDLTFFNEVTKNWSAREKECYEIYCGVKLFEDLLDNRYFILKTDHMVLRY